MTSLFIQKAPHLINKLMADFAMSPEDGAAIIGNAGHESGGLVLLQEINPTLRGSRGGFGWFQWTGPRRRAFEAYCKSMMMVPESDGANYAFLCHELRGPEKAAVAAVKRATGLMAKVVAFEEAYERAGVKHYDSRLLWAQKALQAHKAASLIA